MTYASIVGLIVSELAQTETVAPND